VQPIVIRGVNLPHKKQRLYAAIELERNFSPMQFVARLRPINREENLPSNSGSDKNKNKFYPDVN